jgi:hypothetical protein
LKLDILYILLICPTKNVLQHIFRSFEMLIERISLSFGSMATQSHIHSEPTITTVSPMKYSQYSFSSLTFSLVYTFISGRK